MEKIAGELLPPNNRNLRCFFMKIWPPQVWNQYGKFLFILEFLYGMTLQIQKEDIPNKTIFALV